MENTEDLTAANHVIHSLHQESSTDSDISFYASSLGYFHLDTELDTQWCLIFFMAKYVKEENRNHSIFPLLPLRFPAAG